jgi:hypothetical protein
MTHDAPTTPPATADALHAWIASTLNLAIPRQPMDADRQAPFEYIRHAFFEGAADLAGACSSRPPTAAPVDCIVWANRGGGKTLLGALATTLDLVFKPGIQVRILAGSFEQAQHMHAHLRAFFDAPALAPLLDGRPTDRRLKLLNRSVAVILSQSQASVRGTRLQKIRCDEVELFTRDLWNAAQLTTRSRRCGPFHVRGSVECLSTLHVSHGIMADLVQEARQGRRTLFRWGLPDVLETCPGERDCAACSLWPECRGRAKQRAPGGHFRVEDAAAQKRRVPLAVWQSEMLCLRATRGYAVLPEFDPALHVRDDPPPEVRNGCSPLVCGMDFGIRAPTAVLWARLDERGRLWVVDERLVAGAILDEHIEAILASPHGVPRWVGADPAGNARNDHTGLSSIQRLRAAGLSVRARPSLIASGLQLIRARLRAADGSPPRLLIHPRCARLVESLEKYHYDPENPQSEEPVKDGYDHAIDALRYMVIALDAAASVTQANYLRQAG